ncbi:MAG: class I SAM-dependent methyltransferase [Candidatus Sericytochromatia bacterium]
MQLNKDNKEKMKELLIESGLDFGRDIVFSVVKWIVLPKKKTKDISVSNSPQAITVVKEKKKTSLLKKLAIALLLKELVYERIKAKLVVKPDDKDYSWIMDYPIKVVDLNLFLKSMNKGSRILDLGSGKGYFALEASKAVPQGKVFCVDINLESLKEAKYAAMKKSISNIEFHRAKIEKLPFEGGSFDHAFLNMTFGQIPDKIRALSEIYRTLKKGGYLYVTELLLDKHYCLETNVAQLASSVGFRPVSEKGNFVMYTIILRKD